jgi:hypothetical protein
MLHGTAVAHRSHTANQWMTEEAMAKNVSVEDAPPAPPDKPTPPAGEPETASADAEQRHRQISEAAYYRAQQRGFSPGADQEDWFEAEKEIDRGATIPKRPEENDFPTPK